MLDTVDIPVSPFTDTGKDGPQYCSQHQKNSHRPDGGPCDERYYLDFDVIVFIHFPFSEIFDVLIL